MEAIGIGVIVGLSGITASLAVLLYLAVGSREECQKKLSTKRGELREAREKLARAGTKIAQHEDETQALVNRIETIQKTHDDDWQRFKEHREKLNKRIDELMHQNQNLAERVASLRQSGLPEGGDDFHVEDAEPREPLSDDLAEFLSGIEHPDAKTNVENRIMSMRERGMEDEEIYRTLDQEGTVL